MDVRLRLRRSTGAADLEVPEAATEVLMTEIIRRGGTGSGLARLEQRGTARSLARLQANTEIGLASIESAAMLQVAKADAVAYVGRAGMQAVAMVSQFEQQLGTMCPLAVTRLQGIADMTALGVAEVVAETVRKVGR